MLGLNIANCKGERCEPLLMVMTNSKFRTGDSEYNINIVFEEGSRQSIDDIENMMFINSVGQQVNYHNLLILFMLQDLHS